MKGRWRREGKEEKRRGGVREERADGGRCRKEWLEGWGWGGGEVTRTCMDRGEGGINCTGRKEKMGRNLEWDAEVGVGWGIWKCKRRGRKRDRLHRKEGMGRSGKHGVGWGGGIWKAKDGGERWIDCTGRK